MDKFDIYELNIQIWHDNDEWLYSVIQEFEAESIDDDPEVELLLYGSADTLQQASAIVGTFVAGIDFK